MEDVDLCHTTGNAIEEMADNGIVDLLLILGPLNVILLMR